MSRRDEITTTIAVVDRMSKQARRRSAWFLLLVAGVLGLSVFGWLAWHAVSIEQLEAADARHRFDDALSQFESKAPLVARNPSGQFVRGGVARGREPRPQRLFVLAYRAGEGRLVRADVPVWFLTVKGPAAQYALQGTGFDLRTLGLTAGDLSGTAAGIVIDEAASNGDRLLAWTR
jgi:hypothetical protein